VLDRDKFLPAHNHHDYHLCMYFWQRPQQCTCHVLAMNQLSSLRTQSHPCIAYQQVESILNPVRGIRDAQARAGITPTDHSRHNILAIKEQSRLNALQKQQQEQQAQQQLRPQLRRTTSGTGAAAAAVGAGPGGIGRSLSGGGSRAAAVAAAGRQGIVRSVSGSAAAGGRLATSSGGGNDGRDFVQENKAAAAAASRPVKAESRHDSGAAYLQKSEYGQVPAYLLQRKMEMAQQEAAMQAAKQAAQIPAGAQQHNMAVQLQRGVHSNSGCTVPTFICAFPHMKFAQHYCCAQDF
jgi:hypothetical protein